MLGIHRLIFIAYHIETGRYALNYPQSRNGSRSFFYGLIDWRFIMVSAKDFGMPIDMSGAVEQMQQIQHANAEFLQSLAAGQMEMINELIEGTMQHFEALRGAKSVQQMVELQNQFLTDSAKKITTQGRRLFELYMSNQPKLLEMLPAMAQNSGEMFKKVTANAAAAVKTSPLKAAVTMAPKPVAKNTAAPKPVAKKAAAPKPAVKKAAAPKPVAKKAAAPKPVAKKAAAPKPAAKKAAAPASAPAAKPFAAASVTKPAAAVAPASKPAEAAPAAKPAEAKKD
jgi:phasin family protein